MKVHGTVLLGASRAGVSVASALAEAGLPLLGVWNRSRVEGTDIDRSLLGWQPGGATQSRACLYMIAVADDAIGEVASWLGDLEEPDSESLICHLSGAMGPDVVLPACAGGAKAAAIHPLRSFADRCTGGGSLRGVYCGMESDDAAATTWMADLLVAAGAHVFDFPAAHRFRYHMAATASCNFLVTLFDLACRHMAATGMEEAVARAALLDLMGRTLTNIEQVGSEAALTGPIVRGDAEVVRGHLELLNAHPKDKALYCALARATRDLGLRDGRPSEEASERILRLIEGDDSCQL